MKLRRVIRSIRFFNAILLVGVIVSVCLLLYNETIHRKVDEEEILVELTGFVKQNEAKKEKGKGDGRKQIEMRINEWGTKETQGSPLTSKEQAVHKFTSESDFRSVTITRNEDCFAFEKDRPNWTIKYRGAVSKNCLQTKYHPKWVKRILLANGSAVYKGCTRNTRRCGNMPYFDRKLNTRINTPPCCLKYIIEIFRNFAHLIARFGGRYFLFGGGLIGWYRNRQIVPYDHDLDVIVGMEFWKSKRFKLFLNELHTSYGYQVKWLGWNKIKIYYSKHNHNFIDLWPFSRRGKDKIRIKSRMWKVHNASHLLPLKKSKFEGFPIWVPRRPKSMLTAEYGVGWQNELTCKVIGKWGNCKA